jgi:para-aminobenzoate synthetase component I
MTSHPRGRYSILAISPLATLNVDAAGYGTLNSGGKNQQLERPFQFLESWLQFFYPQLQSQSTFCGGILGFLSYESYAQRFKLVPHHRSPDFPDAFFMLVDTGLVIDHLQNDAWVFSLGLQKDLRSSDRSLAQRRCAELYELLQTAKGIPPREFQLQSLSSNLNRETYLEKIASIQEAILRGDCYQVNFSQKFSAKGDWDPASLYLRLRSVSPAPQMAFLNLGETQILSASPEVLLETAGTTAVSYPIKGTRPRCAEPVLDREMAETLLQSEKDAAELLMIVDLVRNDLGKFCDYGSVRVPFLKTLESYSQVHHLVATVEGGMQGPFPIRALLELSPGGSITGAPKLKSMEIINQLEEGARGIYTGSIGYAGFNSRSCFNIAIRTAVLRKDVLEYSAGGGIVADSLPEAEYEESLQKTEGFFQALGLKRKK